MRRDALLANERLTHLGLQVQGREESDMTINELILALQELPQDRRNEPVKIYVDCGISGYLDVATFDIDEDREDPYHAIRSVRLREATQCAAI
jgi:hypothetical protein